MEGDRVTKLIVRSGGEGRFRLLQHFYFSHSESSSLSGLENIYFLRGDEGIYPRV